MEEALDYYLPIARTRSTILDRLQLAPRCYYLPTVHRPENADVPGRLKGILQGLAALDRQVVLPIHPRTPKMIEQLALGHFLKFQHIRSIEPLG